MRIVFGVLSLLVVLAIVGSLVRTQLHALDGGAATRASAAAGTAGLTVPQQSQNIQQQFRDDTDRALQQGVDRNARAPQ